LVDLMNIICIIVNLIENTNSFIAAIAVRFIQAGN